MGILIPNSFQVPNLYVDRLLPLLTPEEFAVLSYTTRRIFGFNKRRDRLSIPSIAEGCGISEENARKRVQSLCAFGVMVRTEENDPRKNQGAEYSLEVDDERINWAALEYRKKQEAEKVSKRTQQGLAKMNTPETGGVVPCDGGAYRATEGPTVRREGGGTVARVPQNPSLNPGYIHARAHEGSGADEAPRFNLGRVLWLYYGGASGKSGDTTEILEAIEEYAANGVTLTQEVLEQAAGKAGAWWKAEGRGTPPTLRSFFKTLRDVLQQQAAPEPRAEERPAPKPTAPLFSDTDRNRWVRRLRDDLTTDIPIPNATERWQANLHHLLVEERGMSEEQAAPLIARLRADGEASAARSLENYRRMLERDAAMASPMAEPPATYGAAH